MAKEKMTVTLDPSTLADVDADARQAGLNRSEFVERALRREHYRRLLDRAGRPAHPTPNAPAESDQQLRDLLAWQRNPS
ncbi:CopG family transcriptional regulator [Jiangella ureilytica]|uniref:CopG family transcriptional regulator n=1 Tax=Jiangella ureilytica TaxID=2530374 RepID=A0A4R4RHC2_9ACTN|nr:ribbon-helix-helix domain-containing protein [Jiangella ureilytica]TDC48797.1 CopG family transcriptional regulator [Jiangella ureilytica]